MEEGIALFLFIVFLILLVVVVAILAFIFWIIMIVDCAKREFKSDAEKIVWILILVFLGIIGALIYYFAVAKDSPLKRKK